LSFTEQQSAARRLDGGVCVDGTPGRVLSDGPRVSVHQNVDEMTALAGVGQERQVEQSERHVVVSQRAVVAALASRQFLPQHRQTTSQRRRR